MSDIRGLCHICHELAQHTCKLCGRATCKEHYDPLTKLCQTCKKGRRAADPKFTKIKGKQDKSSTSMNLS